MKILFVNFSMHSKNMHALLKYGHTIVQTKNPDLSNFNLSDFDVVYSPGMPLNVSKYPNTKFIFGPHFSIFPDPKKMIPIKGRNVIYVQPSDWARDAWRYNRICLGIRIETLPFGVDTNKFNQVRPIHERTQVFIYFKNRHPMELNAIEQFLKYNKINYKIFNSYEKYEETDYLRYLHNSRFGIWVGSHESQGFALEEALSCNVPLLVWNAISMSQDYIKKHPHIKSTSIPYWDDTCGEYFINISQLSETYDKFITNINNNNYYPRKYILENLSMYKCNQKLEELVKSM